MDSVTELAPDSQIAVISEKDIKDKIYFIRGQQVMLDFELAEIYGYTTKAFNQQVKNNIKRFDEEDLRFQLSDEEVSELSRSKILTSMQTKGIKGGRTYNPYAFTEQGIYMLMTVLKGELAISQSKALVRTFKRMKDMILSDKMPFGGNVIESIAYQTMQNSKAIAKIEENMITKADLPDIIKNFGFSENQTEHLIVNGDIVEAALAYKHIYSKAKSTIYIIDNYIGLKTLHLFKDVSSAVKITVFSDNLGGGLTKSEYIDFNKQYGLSVDFKKIMGIFHDRYIAIDFNTNSEKVYHCGASSKDAGNRITTISLLSDKSAYRQLFGSLQSNPMLKLK